MSEGLYVWVVWLVAWFLCAWGSHLAPALPIPARQYYVSHAHKSPLIFQCSFPPFHTTNTDGHRDLGTSLSKLEVLWMSKCNLSDLNGISMLPSLRVRHATEIQRG